MILNKIKQSYFLFTILILCFLNCTGNIKKINEESERDKADQFIDIFYENVNNGKYKRNLFSNEFFNSIDTVKFDSAFSHYMNTLGKYENREISKWTTERFTLSNEWFVSIIYLVEYENYYALERFDLVKENDSVLIRDYEIDFNVIPKNNSLKEIEK